MAKEIKLKYVGFWKRLGAALLDLIVLVLPTLVIAFIAALAIPSIDFIASVLVFSIGLLILEMYLISKFGGTPGKLILEIKIVDNKGRFLSCRKAGLRKIFNIIMFLFYGILFIATNSVNITSAFGNAGFLVVYFAIVVIIVVDPLIIIFNDQKRAIHDMIAGSYVVEAPKKEKYMRIKK